MKDTEHISQLLQVAGSIYTQLEARVLPDHHPGGRRTQPSSKAPLQVAVISHLEELRVFLGTWIGEGRGKLDPVQRIDLTAREGVHCPWCQGRLMAYLHDQRPDTSEIRCLNPNHSDEDGPRMWTPDQWRRLGLLAGTVEDLRHGPRLRLGA